MSTKTRNIGGSILPSSNPQILQPLKFSGGELQVRANLDRDTHELWFTAGEQSRKIASHPNGYSCHALAKRIAGETRVRAVDQAQYIIDCGGTADFEAIQLLTMAD
jgi:hypothetical protein